MFVVQRAESFDDIYLISYMKLELYLFDNNEMIGKPHSTHRHTFLLNFFAIYSNSTVIESRFHFAEINSKLNFELIEHKYRLLSSQSKAGFYNQIHP